MYAYNVCYERVSTSNSRIYYTHKCLLSTQVSAKHSELFNTYKVLVVKMSVLEHIYITVCIVNACQLEYNVRRERKFCRKFKICYCELKCRI